MVEERIIELKMSIETSHTELQREKTPRIIIIIIINYGIITTGATHT